MFLNKQLIVFAERKDVISDKLVFAEMREVLLN
jgi:hypothetical protein